MHCSLYNVVRYTSIPVPALYLVWLCLSQNISQILFGLSSVVHSRSMYSSSRTTRVALASGFTLHPAGNTEQKRK